MKTIIYERVVHDDENRVALRFPYESELIGIVRSISGAKWSKSMHCWHIPYNEDVIQNLPELFRGKANIEYSAIKINHDDRLTHIAAQGNKNSKNAVNNPVFINNL